MNLKSTTRHIEIPRVGSTLLFLALILTIPALVHADGQYEISWYTIDGGGGTSTDGPEGREKSFGAPEVQITPPSGSPNLALCPNDFSLETTARSLPAGASYGLAG
jgi:hypothetical protein